jgi:predicted  nucleic acid-binding Zn-ribbon protein
MAEEGFYR